MELALSCQHPRRQCCNKCLTTCHNPTALHCHLIQQALAHWLTQVQTKMSRTRPGMRNTDKYKYKQAWWAAGEGWRSANGYGYRPVQASVTVNRQAWTSENRPAPSRAELWCRYGSTGPAWSTICYDISKTWSPYLAIVPYQLVLIMSN